MGIGRSFEEALQKALRMVDETTSGFDPYCSEADENVSGVFSSFFAFSFWRVKYAYSLMKLKKEWLLIFSRQVDLHKYIICGPLIAICVTSMKKLLQLKWLMRKIVEKENNKSKPNWTSQRRGHIHDSRRRYDSQYCLYLLFFLNGWSFLSTGTPAADRQTHAGSCSCSEEGLGRWTAVQLDQNWQVVPL